MGLTAQLKINYKSMLMSNSPLVFTIRVKNQENRKVWMEGQVCDPARAVFESNEGVLASAQVYAECEALFVVPKPSWDAYMASIRPSPTKIGFE